MSLAAEALRVAGGSVLAVFVGSYALGEPGLRAGRQPTRARHRNPGQPRAGDASPSTAATARRFGRRSPLGRGGLAPGRVSLAWVLGVSLLAPAALLAGLAGLPLAPWSLLGIGVTLACALRLAHAGFAREGLATGSRYRTPEATGESPPDDRFSLEVEPQRSLLWISRLVLAGAVIAVAWKVAAMPLWSWDHFAIWGVKARRMVAEGSLDLAFLRTQEMVDSRPDYPLGLPLAWRVLALGAAPTAAGYKLAHGLFGLALLALLRRGLGGLGNPAPLANALTAAAACLPLFWDTEAVGLAEMPLALWTLAAAVLLLELAPQPAEACGGPSSLALPAGLALGFLPWIKPEGASLAVFLGLAGLALAIRRDPGEPEAPLTARGPEPAAKRMARRGPAQRLAACRGLAGAAAAGLVLVAVERTIAALHLAPGVSFLSGDPLARLGERLPRAGELLARMGSTLLARDTLGFWVAFGAALLGAALRRRAVAAALAGAVLGQLALYAALPFLVYLPPEQHLDASFARVTAALMPLGLLAIGAAVGSGPLARPAALLRRARGPEPGLSSDPGVGSAP